MSAHTDGLLQTHDDVYLVKDDGFCIAAALSGADARRLAACWNACAGITQEHFDGDWTAKGLSAHAKSREIECERLRAELADMRPKLAAALDYIARQRQSMTRVRREPETPLEVFTRAALILAANADHNNLVLTIAQRPRLPLAIGNYETVVDVRAARERAR